MSSSLVPVPITSQKHDPAWKHCQMFKNEDRVLLKCIYCGKMFKGGGIHRIKEHLAGHKGNASTCLRVPPDVQSQMQQSLDGVVAKKRKKQKIEQEIMNVNPVSVSSEMGMITIQPNESNELQLIDDQNAIEENSSLLVISETGLGRSLDKRKTSRGKGTTSPGANADEGSAFGKLALSSKKVENHIHMAIGRFLYDIGAPLNAVNSVYFQVMFHAIASGGLGVSPPSCNELRGWILKNSVEELKNDVDKYKVTWGRTGCSVLVDQWSTETGRTVLNFYTQCPEGTAFLKSIDASDIIGSSELLYESFKQVVEEVGVGHVVQVITSSQEHFIAAGKRLSDTFPTLYWTPCVAHCIDMILEDFGNLDWISEVVEQARSITRVVYNHCGLLSMVRRYTFGNDIVDPYFSCSATNFTTLKQMVDLKHNFQSMITSQEWMDCPYSKKEGLDYLSNQNFWSSCSLIVSLTVPLIQALKIASSEKRPAMGYVYAGIYRAKESIKKELVKREDYMLYWNIIDLRWEQQQHWHNYIQSAGFYLNPKFFYSIQGDTPNGISSGMFDCIERLVPDTRVQDKIIKEMNLYKTSAGDFGRKVAVRARDNLLPAEWWSTYGGGCPNLARLAIRILSQTCSTMSCRRSRSPFEQLHKTSNYIEHQRLSDLAFVHYNLKLRNNGQESIDPISVDYFNIVEEWVRAKEIYFEECGNSDWTTHDLSNSNIMIVRSSNDDPEDLGTGFDDYEIFNCVKDGEDKMVEEKPASN